MRVSEICVKRIHVNQGLVVLLFSIFTVQIEILWFGVGMQDQRVAQVNNTHLIRLIPILVLSL